MGKDIKRCFVSIHFNQKGFSQTMAIRTVWQTIKQIDRCSRIFCYNSSRGQSHQDNVYPVETESLGFRVTTQIDVSHLLVGRSCFTLLTYSGAVEHGNSPKLAKPVQLNKLIP